MASPIEADAAGEPPKKRRTNSSARGVASLTPDQLERKRSNDRAAQRAIRERTKNSIEKLNQRIRELESQQPYHDLQVVLKEKEAVQAQNEDIRNRLENVMAIIQPIVRGSSGLNELASAAEKSPLLIPPHHQHRGPSTDTRQTPTTLHDIATVSPLNGVISPSNADGGRQWLYSSDASASHMRRFSSESAHFGQHQSPHIQTDIPLDERLGVEYLLDNSQRRAVDPNLPPPRQPQASNISNSQHAQYAPPLVAHMTLPRNIEATCPLDNILSEFLQDQHNRAQEGVPLEELAGPLYPNFTLLIDPGRNAVSHPLSKLVIDIIHLFPDISGLPERVALFYVVFLVLRWQIESTLENYERLPDWIAPRPSQLFTAHPCWIDYVPWPKLRDKIISRHSIVSFDSFLNPLLSTISLNWPHESRDCLLSASEVRQNSNPQPSASMTDVHDLMDTLPKEEGQWQLNPAFETHLRDLSNWSLGHSFQTAYPAFTSSVKIK